MTLVACGTAHYACHVAKYWFESLARLPVEIEVASEFRYREPPVAPRSARHLRQPVGRDRRHARRAALHARGGRARRLRRQRRHVDHRARKRPRPADPRRARDRRRLDQGLHLPAHRARGAGDRGRARPGTDRRRRRKRVSPPRSARCPACWPRRWRSSAQVAEIARDVVARARRAVPRARRDVSAGPRRRAEAEGNQLHPRRRLRGGRAQARPDRAGGRRSAGRRARSLGRALRQDRLQHAGGHGPRRPGAADHRRGAGSPAQGTGSRMRSPCPPATRSRRRSSTPRRCSCSPITPRCSRAPTWTSRATSPSP